MQTDFLFYVDDQEFSPGLVLAVKELGLTFEVCSEFDRAQALMDSGYYKIVVIDVDTESLKALQFIEWVQTRCLSAHLALVSRKSYRKEFTQGMALGALDFLGNFRADQTRVAMQLKNCLDRYDKKWQFLTCETPGDESRLCWIGCDAHIRYCLDFARHYSGTQAPILLKGEAGVGKRLISGFFTQYHNKSNVIELNAASLPIFEHKTYLNDAIGKIFADQTVDRLAIIIHHIERLDPEVQEFLAECLKSAVIEWVGVSHPVTLQLIATTTLDFANNLADELIREDLALMLANNVFEIPPLRKRFYDIPLLVQFFIWKHGRGDEVRYFSRDAMDALMRYQWPGNVAELQQMVVNVLKRRHAPMISSRDLPAELIAQSFYVHDTANDDHSELSYNEAKKRVLNKFNRDYIDTQLKKSDNNLTVAAERAGMDRSNFKKIVKKFKRV